MAVLTVCHHMMVQLNKPTHDILILVLYVLFIFNVVVASAYLPFILQSLNAFKLAFSKLLSCPQYKL